METVSITTMKAKLSQYLERVKQGEEVIVTDRGVPVARLVPHRPATGPSAEHIEDLVRRGILRPPQGKLPDDFWDRPRPKVPEGKVLEALQADREEGW